MDNSNPRNQMIQNHPLTPPRRSRRASRNNNQDFITNDIGYQNRLIPRFTTSSCEAESCNCNTIFSDIYDHVNSLSTPFREVLSGVRSVFDLLFWISFQH